MDVSFPEATDLDAVPTGDMPGDKVQITRGPRGQGAPPSPRAVGGCSDRSSRRVPHRRAVVAVHGGSGVGKSEIGSLLAHELNARGRRRLRPVGRQLPAPHPARQRRRAAAHVPDRRRRRAWSPRRVRRRRPRRRSPICRRRPRRRPAAGAGHPWLAVLPEGRAAGAHGLPRHRPTRSTSTRSTGILAAFHEGARPCCSSAWAARAERTLVRRGRRLRHPGSGGRVDARQQRAPASASTSRSC